MTQQLARRVGGALLAIVLILAASARPLAAQEGGRTLSVVADGVTDGRASFRTIPAALAQARAGDTIVVYGGHHAGPLVIDRSVRLLGREQPILDGGGRGTVVTITAPRVELRGFIIRGSGDSLEDENSGVAIQAADVVVADNRLEETLFGIYAARAPRAVIRGNVIHSKPLPLPRRGDPIRIWYSDDVLIEENSVTDGRDAVLWYAQRLTIRDNLFTGGRYGLHFMYCDDALIERNRLVGNSVGAFLMYSRRLHLRNNRIEANRGPSGYGIGLKDVDDAVIEGNLFLDNRVGAFLDNSPREIDRVGRFDGNTFAFNDIAISLMPAVQRNSFTDNSFIENQETVNVIGGGELHGNLWTVDGRGNYWSDYVGYDADGDGVGDIPYHADRLFDSLVDRQAALRLFTYSPAAQAVELAARAFPFIKPQPKLVDVRPRMAPAWPSALPPAAASARWPLGAVALGLSLAGMLLLWPSQRRRPSGGGVR